MGVVKHFYFAYEFFSSLYSTITMILDVDILYMYMYMCKKQFIQLAKSLDKFYFIELYCVLNSKRRMYYILYYITIFMVFNKCSYPEGLTFI